MLQLFRAGRSFAASQNCQSILCSCFTRLTNASGLTQNVMLTDSGQLVLKSLYSVSAASADNNVFCEKLENRSLIRISGSDSLNFLQGLVTNDVQLLNDNRCLYAMMLNVQGRVMYDLILYKTDDDVIVECDRDLSAEILATFKRYRLRKKVDIADIKTEANVWSVFGNTSSPVNVSSSDVILHVEDPRLLSLGSRLILPFDVSGTSAIVGCEVSKGAYRERLCRHGIGEGAVDFPPAQCFPLECNLAFLNGVSFTKGCYIGQELTARTHHTGVIRKRLMPLILSRVTQPVLPDSVLVTSTDKVGGKVRSVTGKYAVGLLRVADVIGKGPLKIKVDDTEIADVETFIPSWWPSQTDPVIQQTVGQPKAQD